MIDRKITPKELAETGLVIDNVEIIPPVPEQTQSQKRNKRELCYYKLFGKVYYQVSDLLEFAEKNKTNAVA
ncbi:MAG: hypothetical protein ACI81I_000721 [Arcobacteraceae bacterium]|jgi:hypothetical protein